MDAEATLESFIDKFDPRASRAQFRRALARVGPLVPGAVLLVYDNYNALGRRFRDQREGQRGGHLGRRLSALGHAVLHERRGMPDPDGLLEGKGSTVRIDPARRSAVATRRPARAWR